MFEEDDETKDLKVGMTFTIAGVYRRRTLIEWLRRRPRKKQIFVVMGRTKPYVMYRPAGTDE